MKKKVLKVEDALKLEQIKKQISNALAEGKATELDAALREFLDTLKNAEDTYDEETWKEEVKKMVETLLSSAEPNDKVKEEIANAIAKRMVAVQNSIKQDLPVNVKNAICMSVLKCNGKEEVRNAVNAVLVQNGVTGLTFEQSVDYTIIEEWGNLNPLFSLLRSVPFTKFFYSEQDMKSANILAKQWSKLAGGEKSVQEIEVLSKEIATKYVYKRQKFANEDLDEIEKAGQAATFLRFINEELDRMIVNTIVMAILIGDTVNDANKRINTFETIGSKNASDVFTTVRHPAVAGAPTLKDVRLASDKVKNPEMKKKVAIMSSEFLTEISEFTYAAGGSVSYRTRSEVAEQIGVDEIVVCDLLDPEEGMYCIIMLPDGYWYNEKKVLSVAYPKYEENTMNYQKERNIGGKIHDMHSTAVLKAEA